jgi:glucokinase
MTIDTSDMEISVSILREMRRKRLGSGKGKGISHLVLMLQHSSLLNQERGHLSITIETGQ